MSSNCSINWVPFGISVVCLCVSHMVTNKPNVMKLYTMKLKTCQRIDLLQIISKRRFQFNTIFSSTGMVVGFGKLNVFTSRNIINSGQISGNVTFNLRLSQEVINFLFIKFKARNCRRFYQQLLVCLFNIENFLTGSNPYENSGCKISTDTPQCI